MGKSKTRVKRKERKKRKGLVYTPKKKLDVKSQITEERNAKDIVDEFLQDMDVLENKEKEKQRKNFLGIL